MFVITADQRASRRRPDLVPHALSQLNGHADLDLSLAFVRTAGDEIQGVTSDPRSVVAVCSMLLRDEAWSVGVGAGTVDTPLPTFANEGRGEAFIAARHAVDAAKRSYPAVLLTGMASPDANTVLRLIASLWQRRSPSGWQAVEAMAEKGSAQSLVAAHLGITPQALSQRLRAAAYQPEQDALPLLYRLLSEPRETL